MKNKAAIGYFIFAILVAIVLGLGVGLKIGIELGSFVPGYDCLVYDKTKCIYEDTGKPSWTQVREIYNLMEKHHLNPKASGIILETIREENYSNHRSRVKLMQEIQERDNCHKKCCCCQTGM